MRGWWCLALCVPRVAIHRGPVIATLAAQQRAAPNLSERALVQVTTNFAYLPFGGGRRKCIGDQFALFESIVSLAMLARRFTFEADPSAPRVGMTTGATIHTTEGLHMFLRPRVHAPPHGGAANSAAGAAQSNGAQGDGSGTGSPPERQASPEPQAEPVHV